MEHSAGILIKTASGYLACHPTGKPKSGPHWDIPKGHIESGEQAKEAMLRELQEETGLTIKGNRIVDCGVMPYNSYKDLHMFYTEIDHIDIHSLKCTSTFDLHGRSVPEMNDFMITQNIEVYYKNLQPIVQKCIDMNKHTI